MARANYVEPVPVLRGHLEEILDALDAAKGYHIADDLSMQYKNIGGTSRQSNLTKRIEKAFDRIEGYLTEEEDELPTE